MSKKTKIENAIEELANESVKLLHNVEKADLPFELSKRFRDVIQKTSEEYKSDATCIEVIKALLMVCYDVARFDIDNDNTKDKDEFYKAKKAREEVDSIARLVFTAMEGIQFLSEFVKDDEKKD